MRLICLFTLLFGIIAVQAQQKKEPLSGSVRGVVRDTVHNYVLRSATASVYKAADNSLLSYQITNNRGEFSFNNLPAGLLLKVEISFIGYSNAHQLFTIPADTGFVDLKQIALSPSENTLQEVVVTVPPVSIKGDTLEFNASAFKLDSNAVVEDLLRKIPNITLWADGTITVNGREVKSFLVNGKQFFGDDAKIATQNIPKNAVDKIQAYQVHKEGANLRILPWN